MTDNSPESLAESAYLIWEEADKDTWWLARGHDGTATLVIAPDSLTNHMLVLMQTTDDSPFSVIAAVALNSASDSLGAVAEAKRLAVRWLSDRNDPTVRSSVRTWRLGLWAKVAQREVPLAALAMGVGGLLAFIVAAFFILTGFAGWGMVAVGIVAGAMAGWVLKWLADLKFASVLGPTGRFYSVTGSALIGSAGTVFMFFVLFPPG